MTNRIQWKRVVLEGLVIVLSILLAFGIDAWWESRAEADREQRHLESLAAELQRNGRLLAEAREWYEARYTEVSWLLAVLDGAEPNDAQRLQSAVRGLFGNRTFHLETGAHDALLASGELDLIRDDELRSELAAWPSYVSEWSEEQDAVFKFVGDVLVPAFEEELSLRAHTILPPFPDGVEPPQVPMRNEAAVSMTVFEESLRVDNLLFQRAQGLWHAMRDGETLRAQLTQLDERVQESLER